MECTEAKPLLSAFAAGLTNDLDRAEIQEHLTSCEECLLEVELLRKRAAGIGTSPAGHDWTLEKIFGESSAGGPGPDVDASGVDASDVDASSAEPPPGRASRSAPAPALDPAPAPPKKTIPMPTGPLFVAPEPAPEPAPPPASRPSMILPPSGNDDASAESDSKAAKASSKTARSAPRDADSSWDFEPADAAREAAPPEESILFAQKALERGSKPSNPRAAATRALVWGLGGVAGLGLLAVSVWIAVAVHRAPPRDVLAESTRSGARAARADSSAAVAEDTTVIATSSAAASSNEPTAGGGDPSTEGPASTSPAADAKPIQARTLTSVPTSLASPEQPPAHAPAQPPAHSPAASSVPNRGAASTATPSTPTPSTAARSTAAPASAAGSAKSATPARAATPPVKSLQRDDDDMWPTDDPTPAVPAGPGAKPTAPATTRTVETSVATPPSSTPAANAEPNPAPTESARGADDAPAVQGPLDRLHLATTKATVDRDLPALRQLKSAWRLAIRTAVGPDRARAKREYADCLWQIQALTGRPADQRETFDAYRDYLLSAPAGGQDPRSAERMREMQDALRENP